MNEPLLSSVVKGELLGEAQALAERLRPFARRVGTAEVAWLDPAGVPSASGKPVLIGPNLYSGSAGLALFFAALEHVTGDGRSGELARGTIALLRRQLARLAGGPQARSFRIGAYIGLGAYIYVFLRVAQWLQWPELTIAACDVAALLTPERILADDALDVMSGSAGAILAMLLLDREVPEASTVRPIERAVTCGEHLLRSRLDVGAGPGGWPANSQPPVCGFAHGAAGIAAALAQLAERTSRQDFLDAALEGLAFERRQYNVDRGNWQVLNEPPPAFSPAWCGGAAGIALGRLSMPVATRDTEVEQEIRAAIAATAEEPETRFDYLCCGEMGRADTLAVAAQRLGRSELWERARALARRTVRSAKDRGGYRWSHPESKLFPLGFFTGVSGIGYGLLRLDGNRELPCVLAQN